MTTRPLERRLARLEQIAGLRNQPMPRIGLILPDDFTDENGLREAVVAEHAKPGTLGCYLIEFVGAEDGREVSPDSTTTES